MVGATQRWLLGLCLCGAAACASAAGYWWWNCRPRLPSPDSYFDFTGRLPEAHRRPRIPRAAPPPLFPGRTRPDLVLLFSGQTYGYLQPCGCFRPQMGGLERRYELIRALRDRGWPVAAVELGSLAPKYWSSTDRPKYELRPQGREKFKYAVEALHKMDYAAIGLGLNELEVGLLDCLDDAQNYVPPYFLAANIDHPDLGFYAYVKKYVVRELPGAFQPEWGARAVAAFANPSLPPFAGAAGIDAALPPTRGVRVAYVSVVADSVINIGRGAVSSEHPLNTTIKFLPISDVLPGVLADLAKDPPDLMVLLCQGTVDEAEELARKHPEFHIVQAMAESDQAGVLPRRTIERPHGNTIILDVGHKGKSVGLVGVRRTPGGWDLAYQTVDLSDYFDLPDEAAELTRDFLQGVRLSEDPAGLLRLPETPTNPVRQVLEQYVARIYRGHFLRPGSFRPEPHPLQATPGMEAARYVGAAACKECHPKAYEIWSKSRHSHAYESLVEYGRPRTLVRRAGEPARSVGREYDPTCVGCHVTGFWMQGGFESAEKTPFLKGNQCENCHGPASLHVATARDPDREKVARYALPLRMDLGRARTQLCGRCHDADNDPRFSDETFDEYWSKIRHPRW